MRSIVGMVLLALLGLSAPAMAGQAQLRTLEVPANASWQHAETGMILPSRSAGLVRGAIRDSTNAELDVVVDYDNREEGVVATVYLYKTMTPDAALWFDRALSAIMMRPEYGLVGAAAPTPAAFARPGASTASGLRAALDLDTSNLRGTAVAVVPLGRWLVKVRLSAARLDRAALDGLLTRFIEGLRWPAEGSAERVAVAIQPCPAPLRLRNARILRPEGAEVIMDAMSGVIVAEATDGPPPVYCREPGATLERGVYRPDGASDRYLIALGDAGIALSVGEALNLSGLLGDESRGRRRYSMTLLGRDETSVLPSFNRLPPPEQAMAAAQITGPTVSVSTRDPEDR